MQTYILDRSYAALAVTSAGVDHDVRALDCPPSTLQTCKWVDAYILGLWCSWQSMIGGIKRGSMCWPQTQEHACRTTRADQGRLWWPEILVKKHIIAWLPCITRPSDLPAPQGTVATN